MANRNSAGFGLIPTRVLGQGPATAGFGQYWIDAGDSTAIYNGEAVYSAVGSILGAQGSATAVTLGVLQGVFYNAATTIKPTWSNYYPGGITPTGGGLISAFVYDDPNKLFEIQGSAILAKTAAVGKNTDILLAQGNTINGQSATQMNTAFPPAAASAQLRIVGFSTDPENSDPLTANANWIVRINEHVYSRATGV